MKKEILPPLSKSNLLKKFSTCHSEKVLTKIVQKVGGLCSSAKFVVLHLANLSLRNCFITKKQLFILVQDQEEALGVRVGTRGVQVAGGHR